MEIDNKKAVIYTTRYRYKPRFTGDRAPTYTEYELYIDGEKKKTARCGNYFMSVRSFAKWCKEKYQLSEIEIKKADIHNLGFTDQNL